MSRDHTWMPFYPGDYLRDTMHLTGPQHGAYFLLLTHYWMNGPLPADVATLAAIARFDLKAWKAVWPIVSRFFNLGADGLLHQKRMDRERDKRTDVSAKRSWAGKAGAEAKHGMANAKQNGSKPPDKTVANAKQMPDVCQGSASTPSLPQRESKILEEGEVSRTREGAREGPPEVVDPVGPTVALTTVNSLVKALKTQPPPFTPSTVFQLSALETVRGRPQPQDPEMTPEQQLEILRAMIAEEEARKSGKMLHLVAAE